MSLRIALAIVGYLFLSLVSGTRVLAEPLILYAYHYKPPFIVDVERREGLYFDFGEYVNRKLGRQAVRTEYEPRKRLEARVDSPVFHDAVIGVSPIWFKDKRQTRFLWTSTWMHDRDEVVSLRSNPVNYDGPESVRGKRFAASLGYYYYGLDELAQKGGLIREDSIGEPQSLNRLLLGRIDFAVISRSTLNYLLGRRPMETRLYISPKAHDEFERRILLSPVNTDFLPELERVVAASRQDPEWQAILAHYSGELPEPGPKP
ncbi:MAG: transporter substrate-binding domain-containing protein [Gammaproteobacteria bacterium]|nr:transporter substrate-binding domain-containing protein [Gammaproteobacteria bacterium]